MAIKFIKFELNDISYGYSEYYLAVLMNYNSTILNRFDQSMIQFVKFTREIRSVSLAGL